MNWNKRELKRNAKNPIKKNKVNIIIVCFIIAILAFGYRSTTLGIVFYNNWRTYKTLFL